MKIRVLNIILCLAIFTNTLLGQDFSQKDIIGIEKTSLTTDFNLKVNSNVYPSKVIEKSYSEIFGLAMTNTYTFNNKRQIGSIINDIPGSYENNLYFYNDNGQLVNVKVYNKSGNLRAYFPETFYEYNNQGNLEFVKSKPQFLREDQVHSYSYDLKNRKVIMSSTTGETKTFLMDKKNQIIQRIIDSKDGLRNKTNYVYDNFGRVTSLKKFTKFESPQETKTNQIFTYNDRGDFLLETNTLGNTLVNDYIYDEYGNWIAKFIKSDYKALSNITVREIKYSNGQTTGYIDNTDKNLISKIKNVTKIPSGVVVKLTDNSNGYSIFKNGKKISGDEETFKLFIVGGHLIFLNKIEDEFYVISNYKSRKNFEYLSLEATKAEYGFWIKADKSNYSLYNADGESIVSKIKTSGFDSNKNDFIITLNGGKTIVLKNFNGLVKDDVRAVALYNGNNLETTGNSSVSSNVNKTLTVSQDPNIECIEGNCNNGYGKVRLLDDQTMEGFFENGVANGPLFLRNPKTKLESFTTYRDNYTDPIGFEYNGTEGESTLLIDRNLGMALVYSPKDNKFAVMIVSGSDIQKSITLEPNANNPCQVGNCKDGAGFYVYSNGATYMGFFKNGKSHGPGQLNFTNNQFYIGNFSSGQKDGLGTYVWDSDTNYFGEWKNDKYHGKGVYHYSSTNKKAGLWKNGEYVKSLDGITSSSTNLNKTKNYNSVTSSLDVDENIFIAVKKYIEDSKGDKKYIARMIGGNYETLQKTLSGDALYKQTAQYFIALYKIDKKLPFSIFMKWMYSDSIKPIRNHLPQEIRDTMTKQANGVMNDYNKYINSKETQDKIKKHDGGYTKQ